MPELIALLIQFLPQQIQAIKLLQFVPDAIGTVKELAAYVQRVIAILKQKKLTQEQQDVLDTAITAMASDPYWAEEPE